MRSSFAVVLGALLVGAFLAAFALVGDYPPKAHGQGQNDVIPLVNVWNVAATGSTNVTGGSFTAPYQATVVRIMVVLTDQSRVSLVETDGTTTETYALNGGTALTGGCAYTFVIESRKQTAAPATLTSNFQLETPTTVKILRATAVIGGAD